MNKSANRPKTDSKRKAPRSAWKPGESGNPAGRPKDGESWAAVIASVGNMNAEDLLQFIGVQNDLGQQIALLPKNVQLKYLVVARVFAALMFDPSSGLWKELMERAEGKVTSHVDMTSKGERLSLTERIEAEGLNTDEVLSIAREIAARMGSSGGDKDSTRE